MVMIVVVVVVGPLLCAGNRHGSTRRLLISGILATQDLRPTNDQHQSE